MFGAYIQSEWKPVIYKNEGKECIKQTFSIDLYCGVWDILQANNL